MFFRWILVSLCFLASPIYSESSLSAEKLSNHYSPQFLRILQIVFGTEEILSHGGHECIDIMFDSIDLNHKKVLDIGSGFGGVDIYLAEKFNAEIIGVDMEPYMVAVANGFLEKHHDSLIGQVSFHTLENPYSLDELEDNSFDVVFSKESFYNVPREKKQAYLAEIYRKLRPGGILIFTDWYQGTPKIQDALKRATKNENICQFITPEAFSQMLENTYFRTIFYKSLAAECLQYTRQDMQRLHQNAALISELFGKKVYEDRVQAWQTWLDAQEAQELVNCLFVAEKW
ncbi:MAG: methyltransferase domain-containing protein [Verrucomicrobia bacterium]|nr:methyltransferase domain-containing protein [Verrucomicrobiota bacterium]MDE3046780.1 methyltransferase domain-containing protein [Verrucomicrobiota bacterium]